MPCACMVLLKFVFNGCLSLVLFYTAMEMSSSSSAAAAAVATSSTRRPTDKRAFYRRSNTVSSLPLEDLPGTGAERRRQLEPIIDSPVRDRATTTTTTEAATTSKEEQTKQIQTAGRTATAAPRHGKTSDARHAQICRKTSCNDLLLSSANTSSGSARPLYPAAVTSGLSDANSGRLLSKVKERIRETLLQTTSEWPAVIQERRQRAAIQFEMRAAKLMAAEEHRAGDAATVGDRTGGSKGSEQKCTSTTTAVERMEAARAAFQRTRSASCEDAVSTMLHPTSAGKPGRLQRRGSPSSDVGGIVCSSKDLQSIIELSRQQQAASVSTNDVNIRSSASGTVSAPAAVVSYQELLGEPGAGTRQSKDDSRQSLTVDVHVGCSDGAVVASVSEAKPLDNGKNLLMLSTTENVSSLTSTASDAAADCKTASKPLTKTKPSDVEYDAEGQTWDVYGAALNPEALGDAIQRHLQRIMLTASSIPGMSTQVAAVARAPPPTKDNKPNNDDLTAACAESDSSAERQRNCVQRFLRSIRKRRRPQSSSN